MNPPERIGPYSVRRVLGTSSASQVLLAAAASERLVAVKVLRPEAAADPAIRARFVQEIDAAHAVSGAFATAAVDADPDARIPWLATVYLPDPTLETAMGRDGPMDSRGLRKLGAGLAEALTALHTAGLVYGGLAPSKILMTGDGPRLVSFGIGPGDDRPGDVRDLGRMLTFAAGGSLRKLPPPLRKLIGSCMAKKPTARPEAKDLPSLFLPSSSGELTVADAGATRRRFLATGAAALTGTFAVGGAGGFATHQWAFPPTHHKPKPPPPVLQPLWSRQLNPNTNMVLAGSTLYVNGRPPLITDRSIVPAVVALDAATGRQLWSIQNDWPAVVDGDTIFVLSGYEDTILAVDTATGKERWEVPYPRSGPAAYPFKVPLNTQGIQLLDPWYIRDRILYGLVAGTQRPSINGVVFAFNTTTKTFLWSRQFGSLNRLCVPDAGNTLCGIEDTALYVVDMATGDLLWTRPLKGDGYAGLATSGGTVYVGFNDHCLAIDPIGRSVKWRSELSGSYVAAAGDAVFVTGQLGVACLDAATGRRRWFNDDLQISSQGPQMLGVAGDLVFISFSDDPNHAPRAGIYAYDIRTGAQRWAMRSSSRGDGVGVYWDLATDGRRVFASDGATIHAFQLPAAKASTKHGR